MSYDTKLRTEVLYTLSLALLMLCAHANLLHLFLLVLISRGTCEGTTRADSRGALKVKLR